MRRRGALTEDMGAKMLLEAFFLKIDRVATSKLRAMSRVMLNATNARPAMKGMTAVSEGGREREREISESLRERESERDREMHPVKDDILQHKLRLHWYSSILSASISLAVLRQSARALSISVDTVQMEVFVLTNAQLVQLLALCKIFCTRYSLLGRMEPQVLSGIEHECELRIKKICAHTHVYQSPPSGRGESWTAFVCGKENHPLHVDSMRRFRGNPICRARFHRSRTSRHTGRGRERSALLTTICMKDPGGGSPSRRRCEWG
jgi:hypothetical protein